MSKKTLDHKENDNQPLSKSLGQDITLELLGAWAKEHRVDDVECIVPDIARGKSMAGEKFVNFEKLRLPQSAFMTTVSGDYLGFKDKRSDIDHDLLLVPDPKAAYAVPWVHYPALQIIHHPYDKDGQQIAFAPRNVLRRVLALYQEKGWQPVVAPEIEFYLVQANSDLNAPLEPPVGRSSSSQAYSISAIDEYEEIVELPYDYATAQDFAIDAFVQEAGPAQKEINLSQGKPLKLADTVFILKRTLREAALRCGVHATFMAKPMAEYPGSSMHVHQSIIDKQSGKNIFSRPDGSPDAFHHFIGGASNLNGKRLYPDGALC